MTTITRKIPCFLLLCSMIVSLTVSADAGCSSIFDKLCNDERLRKSYSFRFNDPYFQYQWYIRNNDNLGNDFNVIPVWQRGIFGNGITVCIIDHGIDHGHLDIKNRYVAEASYDMNGNCNAIKIIAGKTHATRCGAQIIAEENNNMCGVGLAPLAKISNIRTLGSALTGKQWKEAVSYRLDLNDIYNCSWGPEDDGKTLFGPNRAILSGILNGILYGRNGYGSLYVFAAGNGGKDDDCNTDGFANSIFTLTVGALTHKNRVPEYVEHCSAMLSVAYSSGDGKMVYTSDNNNKCTPYHGGTSAAASMASAIYAILLSYRQDLTWRDVQAITITSSVVVNHLDQSWIRNGNHLKYSGMFGFGKLDVNRMINVASNWTRLGPPIVIESQKNILNKRISRDNGLRHNIHISSSYFKDLWKNTHEKYYGLTKPVTLSKDVREYFRLEHVSIKVNIKHKSRGNLSIFLKSPSGTVSRILSPRPKDFSTNREYNGTNVLSQRIEDEYDSYSDFRWKRSQDDDSYVRGIKERRHARSKPLDKIDDMGYMKDNMKDMDEFTYQTFVNGGFYEWNFMSTAFWGESPVGTWSLILKDNKLNGSEEGVLHDWTLIFWGEKVYKDKRNMDWACRRSSEYFDRRQYKKHVMNIYFPESGIFPIIRILHKNFIALVVLLVILSALLVYSLVQILVSDVDKEQDKKKTADDSNT